MPNSKLTLSSSGDLILDNNKIVVLGELKDSVAGDIILRNNAEIICRPGARCDAVNVRLETGGCFLVNAGSTTTLGGTIEATNGGFLASTGGVYELEANANLFIRATADSLRFDPGTTFLLGQNANIHVEADDVEFIGTAADPISFERLNPAKRWGNLYLKGADARLEHVLLDGGYKNIDLQARGIVLQDVTSRNGYRNLSSHFAVGGGRSAARIYDSRFADATSVGVVLYQADVGFKDSDIVGSNQAGLWMNSAMSGASASGVSYPFEDNLIEDNGGPREGVEIYSGAALHMDYYNFNTIRNNGDDELYTSGSGRLYMQEGRNTVCEAAYTDFLVREGGTYSVSASRNYWGANAPLASWFSGSVSYYPWLTSNPAGACGYISVTSDGPVATARRVSPAAARSGSARSGSARSGSAGSGATRGGAAGSVAARSVAARPNAEARQAAGERDPETLRQPIAEAQAAFAAALAADPLAAPAEAAPALVAALDFAQRRDAEDATGTAQTTRRLLERAAAALPTAQPGSARHATAERAALMLLDRALPEAFAAGTTETVRAGLAEVGPLLVSAEARGEWARMEVDVLAGEGRDAEALARLEAAAEAGLVEAGYAAVLGESLAMRLAETDAEAVRAPVAASAEPVASALEAVYPNPFRPSARVAFVLGRASEVEVTVYDVLGRAVRVVASGRYEAGRHEAMLEGTGLASGTYVVRARLGETVQTQTVTLLK
ncbi:MAG: T9SS type A sorting domain-containing protein [Bacteroidota bacterium]